MPLRLREQVDHEKKVNPIISVIIPAHNEARHIGNVVSLILALHPQITQIEWIEA